MKKCNFHPLYGIRFVQRYSNLKIKKETSLNCEEPPFYSSIQSIFGRICYQSFASPGISEAAVLIELH